MDAASSLHRTRAAAATMLHDFASNGVDEDLEELRAMWNKPPTPPDSDDDDMEDYFTRGFGAKIPWRGAVNHRKVDREKARVQRVRSGALDYRSAERLDSLTMLRRVVEAPNEQLAFGDDVSMAALLLTSHQTPMHASSRSSRKPHGQRDGPTSIERHARFRGGGHGQMDWATWESRWAEQLRGLASAAERARRTREESDYDFDRGTARGARHNFGMPQHPESPPHQRPPPRTRRAQTPPRRPSTPPPPPRQPPPPMPPPPKAKTPPQKTAAIGRQFSSWSAFDAAFTSFEQQLPNMSGVKLEDIPFPPSADPAGLVEAGVGRSDAARKKKLLHKALLRWHPDKWQKVSSKVSEAQLGALGEKLREITQALVEQRD